MTAAEIIRLVLTFLGGGLLGALVSAYRSEQSERKARRVTFLDGQLRELYGPLQFFTSQNALLFEHNRRLHDAYKNEYIDKKWSSSPLTRERLEEQTTTTIQVANEFIQQVRQNNEHIMEILEANYSLIEPSDIDILSRFVLDYKRHIIETDESGLLRAPLAIYEQVGDISFMRPEMIELVDIRFKSKKLELEKLLK